MGGCHVTATALTPPLQSAGHSGSFQTPFPPLNDLAHLRLMTWTRFLLRAGKLSFV